jgi:hypothetical protein
MHGRRVKIVSVSPDSELAHFFGFAVGDGSFSDRTISIHQSLKEKDNMPVLESLVTRLSRRLGGGVNKSIHQERLLDLTWCNSTVSRIIMFAHEVRYDQINGFLNGRFSRAASSMKQPSETREPLKRWKKARFAESLSWLCHRGCAMNGVRGYSSLIVYMGGLPVRMNFGSKHIAKANSSLRAVSARRANHPDQCFHS